MDEVFLHERFGITKTRSPGTRIAAEQDTVPVTYKDPEDVQT